MLRLQLIQYLRQEHIITLDKLFTFFMLITSIKGFCSKAIVQVDFTQSTYT